MVRRFIGEWDTNAALEKIRLIVLSKVMDSDYMDVLISLSRKKEFSMSSSYIVT